MIVLGIAAWLGESTYPPRVKIESTSIRLALWLNTLNPHCSHLALACIRVEKGRGYLGGHSEGEAFYFFIFSKPETARPLWRDEAINLSICQSDFHRLLGYGKMSFDFFNGSSDINTKWLLTGYRYLYVMMWYLLYPFGRADRAEEANTAWEGLPRTQSTRLLAAHLHQI